MQAGPASLRARFLPTLSICRASGCPSVFAHPHLLLPISSSSGLAPGWGSGGAKPASSGRSRAVVSLVPLWAQQAWAPGPAISRGQALPAAPGRVGWELLQQNLGGPGLREPTPGPRPWPSNQSQLPQRLPSLWAPKDPGSLSSPGDFCLRGEQYHFPPGYLFSLSL